MGNIYSVCIVRGKDQVLERTFLKEFLKLSGIYVQECIVDEFGTAKEPEHIGCDICIKTEDVKDDQYLYTLKRIDSSKSDEDHLTEMQGTINRVLEQISESELWGNLNDLKELLDIFFSTDYLYYNYLSHLYLYQMSEEEKRVVLDAHIKCFNKMSRELKDGEKTVFFEYAYWNCARKINRLCTALSTQEVFNNKKVMEKVSLLSDNDKEFTMAKVLIGLIGLSTNLYWPSGESALKQAMEDEKGKKYSSFMHYALGHFYELHSESDVEKVWKEYEEAVKVNPESYRGRFKIACRKFNEHDKEDAYRRFYAIYLEMKEKKEHGYIRLLELEYYYKCIQILNSNYLWGKEIEREAVLSDDCQSIFEDGIFMRVLKQNDRKVCKEYFIQKMQGHRQNDILGR